MLPNVPLGHLQWLIMRSRRAEAASCNALGRDRVGRQTQLPWHTQMLPFLALCSFKNVFGSTHGIPGCFVFSTGTPQAMLHWALPRVDQMERSQPLVPVEAKVQTWICRAASPAARGLGWLQAERSPCSPQALFPWDSLGIALPSPRSHPWACWRPALRESSCAWSHCRDKILHPGSAAAT